MEYQIITKEFQDQVIDKLPLGIVIIDMTGRISHMNPAARKIWAVTAYVEVNEYSMYKGWWSSTGKRIKTDEWASFRAIKRGEVSRNEEILIENFAGEMKHILNSAMPLKDEHGNVAGAIMVNEDISDRKRIEAECLRNMDLLETVFSSIDLLIAYTDREFRFIKVNRAYAEADNRHPDFFVGKSHFDLYPNPENEAIFRKVVETGEPFSVRSKPFVYKEHPERGTTWWDWSLQPVKDAGGAVTGLVLSLVNVTEYKNTEEKLERALTGLRDSEMRLRSILDNMGNVVYIADIEERLVFLNRLGLSLLGRSIDELYGKSVFQIFPPEIANTIHHDHLMVLRSDKIVAAEEHIPTREGIHTFLATRFPLKGSDGKAYAVCGVSTDITDLKKAGEALKESEKRLHDILDHMGNAVYLKDLEERYLFANRSFLNFLGKSMDEVIGRTVHDLYPPEMATVIWEHDSLVLKTGILMEFEERFQLHDREHVFLSTRFPLKDIKGVPYAICGVSTDITNLKRAEDEIRNLNKELEQRVAARTEEVRKTADDLARANVELEAFTYSVAHDLRSPLRLIEGFSHSLVKRYQDQLDSLGQDHLMRMRGAVKRMDKLIDDLMNFSYALRAELNLESLDLTGIASSIIMDLKRAEPERQVEFRAAEDLRAVGDRKLVRMLLENLLGNAWKYTSKQPKAIIEMGKTEEAGRQVFFIRDNGIGFGMDDAEKIFEPFHRLQPADEIPGTGVGLATVRRIIHRHGGKVWAEGQTDSGATFYFQFE